MKINKYILPIAFGLLAVETSCMTYNDSYSRQEELKRQRAMKFINSHNCKLVESQPAQDSYDYATGKVDQRPARSKYQCEGLNNPITIFDKPR